MTSPRLSSSRLVAVVFAAGLAAGCTGGDVPASDQAAAGAPTQPAQNECRPVETREPNAAEQKPAFAGQTRACGITSTTQFDVTVVAKGLEHPWAVEPLDNGDYLVTERPGRMRLVTAAGQLGEPIAGVPAVFAQGQGGLLDVALSPDFAKTRLVYWSFSEPRQGGNATSVARGVLSADNRRLDKVSVIFRATPAYDGTLHFGSRLAFGPDGLLYVTLGERSDVPMRKQAQQLDSHMGKILRLRPDGSAAPDNPFAGKPGALPEIWTLGHRNIQASSFDGQGRFWAVEHGPRGGDELNLIQPGRNYGWPLVSYGQEYSRAPIPGAVTAREGFEQPIYYWDPVIAPSGAQFYSGDAFPEWRGNLFIGGMGSRRLVRLTLENDRVTGEEHLLTDRKQRVRDVRQAPDGALVLVTDEDKGEVWKITPRK
jgi:glucose/arabinose dehydrogenase